MSYTSQLRERTISVTKKLNTRIPIKLLVLTLLVAGIAPTNTATVSADELPATVQSTESISVVSAETTETSSTTATETAPAEQPATDPAPAAEAAPAEAPAAEEPATQPAGIQPVDGTQYPYADVPFPNEESDPWGMYKRQCVSYTAWAVTASGRNMPYWGGVGNANQWPDNARNAGIPVDETPRAGDVAIMYVGWAGHAMYVDSVNDDGTINISQYNGNYDGTYSTATISASGLQFIHFP
jgi:surface antigen